MVAPVTGPFNTSKSVSGHGPGTYRTNKTSWRQVKPYTLSLAYTFFYGTCDYSNFASLSPDNGASSSNNYTSGGTHYFSVADSATIDAQRKAMAKLRGVVSNRSEWLVNYIERDEAIKMILKRALQISGSIGAARRGDFSGLARSLNVKALKPSKLPKSGANLWLEYHFGWEPLIKDIYAAVDTLQQPVKNKPIRGVGKTKSTNNFSQTFVGSRRVVSVQKLEIFARCGCSLVITNPALWLANQMGLINPLTVAWELVPYSFVVDWFVPVGTFLNSYTEWFGSTLSNSFTSVKTTEVIDYQVFPLTTGLPYSHAINRGISMNRILSLPDASLKPVPLKGPSAVRAATAISLLIQQMRSLH